jgi:hypothetical protein
MSPNTYAKAPSQPRVQEVDHDRVQDDFRGEDRICAATKRRPGAKVGQQPEVGKEKRGLDDERDEERPRHWHANEREQYPERHE